MAQWKKVRPNIDYHVEIERHYYRAPYQLVPTHVVAMAPCLLVEWPATIRLQRQRSNFATSH
jgi:hypothetical protein